MILLQRLIRIIMNWININDDKPKRYETVIISSVDGIVKPATYFDNGKFDTYLDVTHWMHMPEPPKIEEREDVIKDQPIKKKRGRPKKV